ncbi:MAG: N-formylglutamate amidohydrolase [Candidatus Hermodarchaeota archaeon]
MDNLGKYIKYKKGSIPLILSVPHGGTLECKEIPKRVEGIFGIDKNTISVAHEFIKYIEKFSKLYYSTKKTPSYVMNRVHRSKIDVNRTKSEAYYKNSHIANRIYDFYHKKIDELIRSNLKTFNKSILIDLHGFEKDKRPTGYRDVDIVLGTNNLASILNSIPIRRRDRDKNLRGEIIKKLLEFNIQIAPGHSRRGEYILTGGFITQKYGASSISNSQAIQIELSDRIRVHDRDLKAKVLNALAHVFLKNLN